MPGSLGGRAVPLIASLRQRRADGGDGGFELRADFECPPTGISALFGPSGSGKTTVLHCIAGLWGRGGASQVRLGSELWQAPGHWLPSHRRGVGLVFQEPRLFPWLSVDGNLRFAMRRRCRTDGPAAAEAISALGLEPLLRRSVCQLSGGEQRRVALARALCGNPRLLLLDEPLTGLDAAWRRRAAAYLCHWQRAARVPVLLVSHQFEELLRMVDRVIPLRAGTTLAVGRLAEQSAQLDSPLAPAEHAAAVLEGRLLRHDDRFTLSELRVEGHTLWLGRLPEAPGQSLRLRILARDVSLCLAAPRDTSVLNVLPVTVVDRRSLARGMVLLRLRLGEQYLLARLSRKSEEALALRAGLAVYAQIKTTALYGYGDLRQDGWATAAEADRQCERTAPSADPLAPRQNLQ